MSERTRPVWNGMSSELKDFLADLAFRNGKQMTPEMERAITNNAIQDVIEAEQAGEGEQ